LFNIIILKSEINAYVYLDWIWVKVLRRTWHNTGHFGDVLPSQSHG